MNASCARLARLLWVRRPLSREFPFFCVPAAVVLACCSLLSRGAVGGEPGDIESQLKEPERLAEWERQAAQLRESWARILGTCDLTPPALSPQSLGVESDGVIVRQRVRYAVLPGVETEAFLLWKLGLRLRGAPGVVVFHSTSSAAAEQPAGLADRPSHHLGLHLARAGFVVCAPRCYIFEPGRDYGGNTRALLERFPRWTGMGRMLWDGMRAVDLLVSHPLVDRRRIGAAGHSLGAKETLYLAAFDGRVAAAAFSEGGIGIRFSNWDAPWYLGDQVNDPGFRHDHDELIALIAPRPFLLIAGDAADGERSRPYVERAKRVYGLYGADESLRLFNHRRGHSLPPEAIAAIVGFFRETIGDQSRPGRDQDAGTSAR